MLSEPDLIAPDDEADVRPGVEDAPKTRFGVPLPVLMTSATHLVNDTFTNIYAPLLPLFIPKLHLSLAAAGMLAAWLQIAGSIAQMISGPLADRWRPRVLVTIGPIAAVAVLSLAGLSTSRFMLGTILVLGALGSAAFHPAAAAIVNRVGGARRGTAMSVHVTGGALGTAIGPMLFAPFAQHFGLSWTPILGVPGVVLLVLMLRSMPDIRLTHKGQPTGFSALRPYAFPLFLLWCAVVVRTVVSLGFSTFLPVLLTRKGMSVSEAGLVAGVYLVAGSIGGLAGGPFADRFGPRRIIAWSLALTVPLLLAALFVEGPFSYVLLTIGGFFLGSTLPVNITYAHAIAPVSTATVSGLMLGVAWGVGGLAVPIVGSLGDSIGLQPALGMLAVLPLLASALTLRLPERSSHN